MEIVDKSKRKYRRRKIRIKGLCWEYAHGRKLGSGFKIITKDLSGGGIGFYSKNELPIAAVVALELCIPGRDEPVQCVVQVIRVEDILDTHTYVIGTCFREIRVEDRSLVAKALGKMDLYLLLENANKKGATDLHLTVGSPPMIRCKGRICHLGSDRIDKGQVEAMLFPLLTQTQIDFFEKNKELDFAFSPNPYSRFRVNIHSQKGFVEAAMRSLPTKVKPLEDIGLPVESVKKLCAKKSGLILVAGVTGAGKTTTMGAMIDYMNRVMERVVITIEDPIEYVLASDKCIIKQRELGSDTLSYAAALRRALRQDPDVICVGEILDHACLAAAMRAAETGHLVISTVHSPNATQALECIVNLSPPEEVQNITQQLSSCLLAIIYQNLLPTGKGDRIIASELLLNTPAVKNLIRERKYKLIRNVLQTGRGQGMYGLDVNVKELLSKSLIDPSTAAEILHEEGFTGAEDERM